MKALVFIAISSAMFLGCQQDAGPNALDIAKQEHNDTCALTYLTRSTVLYIIPSIDHLPKARFEAEIFERIGTEQRDIARRVLDDLYAFSRTHDPKRLSVLDFTWLERLKERSCKFD